MTAVTMHSVNCNDYHAITLLSDIFTNERNRDGMCAMITFTLLLCSSPVLLLSYYACVTKGHVKHGSALAKLLFYLLLRDCIMPCNFYIIG